MLLDLNKLSNIKSSSNMKNGLIIISTINFIHLQNCHTILEIVKFIFHKYIRLEFWWANYN